MTINSDLFILPHASEWTIIHMYYKLGCTCIGHTPHIPLTHRSTLHIPLINSRHTPNIPQSRHTPQIPFTLPTFYLYYRQYTQLWFHWPSASTLPRFHSQTADTLLTFHSDSRHTPYIPLTADTLPPRSIQIHSRHTPHISLTLSIFHSQTEHTLPTFHLQRLSIFHSQTEHTLQTFHSHTICTLPTFHSDSRHTPHISFTDTLHILVTSRSTFRIPLTDNTHTSHSLAPDTPCIHDTGLSVCVIDSALTASSSFLQDESLNFAFVVTPLPHLKSLKKKDNRYCTVKSFKKHHTA